MAILEVDGLTKRFGGLLANEDISFQVQEGHILGLIGPNGAGKSTLFDILAGYLPADAGRASFRGTPLLGLPPHRISRLGIGRTFQKMRPFQKMTVAENVMVGALQHTSSLTLAREEALGALHFVGLLDQRDAHSRTLSTGQRKRLELARAVATRPRLLLLDEVTGGVDMRSIPGIIELVRKLRRRGVSMIVVEHNMQVLMSLADRILALHLGRKIAEDTPENIRANRHVIDSYLGTAYA